MTSATPHVRLAAMSRLIFITHPEVAIDPARPVAHWQLSEAGSVRMRAFADGPVAQGITSLWASTETKAVDAAHILASRLGLDVSVDPELGENDRSSTGYLPPPEFEKAAGAFFSCPEQSMRGWERAIDAQRRIRHATDRILTTHGPGDLAILAHGAVGTLLLCSYLNHPIDRALDQPFQGHYWVADLPARTVRHGWLPIAPRT